MHYQIIDAYQIKPKLISEGDTKLEAIKDAADWFNSRIEDDEECYSGIHEEEFTLQLINDDGDVVNEERVIISASKSDGFQGGDIGQRAFV